MTTIEQEIAKYLEMAKVQVDGDNSDEELLDISVRLIERILTLVLAELHRFRLEMESRQENA